MDLLLRVPPIRPMAVSTSRLSALSLDLISWKRGSSCLRCISVFKEMVSFFPIKECGLYSCGNVDGKTSAGWPRTSSGHVPYWIQANETKLAEEYIKSYQGSYYGCFDMVFMVKNVYGNVRGSKDELFTLASIVGTLRNDHGRTSCWINFFEGSVRILFGVSTWWSIYFLKNNKIGIWLLVSGLTWCN